MSDREPTKRDVKSDDPSLSSEANRLLTEELRNVVGSESVEVPAGVVVFFVIAIAAGVAAVETGSVVFLVALLLLLLAGTGAVMKTVLGMVGEREHVDPRTAALLEEEGVDDPDAVLDELVDGVAPERPISENEAGS